MPDPTAPERHDPPDDTPEPPRHTPTVPNPCGATRNVLFVDDGVHVCSHIPNHARSADDREHICCCGFVWNDSETLRPTPPDDTEPATTEDRYWQREAQRARAERDALALRLLQMADAWETAWGGTRIVADVAADAIRIAVNEAGGSRV